MRHASNIGFLFIPPAPFAAVFYLAPDLLPFFSPGEGPAAGHAYLIRQVFFFH